MTEGRNDINGAQKAAVVFMNLGADVAASVARHLTREEMERIGASVISVAVTDAETSVRVAGEFIAAVAGMRLEADAAEFMRSVAASSLGKEEAAAMMSNVMLAAAPQAVAIIRRAAVAAIIDALRDETAQVAALTLSQIDSGRAAAVLDALPQASRAEIILRVAGLARAPGAALREIAAYLEPGAWRGHDVGEPSAAAGVDVDGLRIAAGIVAQLGAGAVETIERIGSLNPQIVAALKEKIRQG